MGVTFHGHLGNVDSGDSPEIPASEWGAVKVAALQSQQAFDAAMGQTAAATWYAARSQGERAELRHWSGVLGVAV